MISLVSLFSVLWLNFKDLYNSSFVLWFWILQYFLYILLLALIDVRMPFVIQGFDCSFFSLDIFWIGAWKESNSLKVFMKLSSYYIIYIYHVTIKACPLKVLKLCLQVSLLFFWVVFLLLGRIEHNDQKLLATILLFTKVQNDNRLLYCLFYSKLKLKY